MIALLVALLFVAAFAASVWSMWITIEPRMAYMRSLLIADGVPALAPVVASRTRAGRAIPAATMALRSVKAAA